ncbi:hypothetical protein NE237_000594 [Protea cynaroides]|uniref:Uncharacterized protein n=1 Tax=Protea cynaroides TaxID=273540 RepID=A0A9Q0KRI8_9MAGN|nr:hypothetical protein NE237_000594 [Protea cynaroides]
MFSESCPPLPWDKEHSYTRDAVELYYEVGSAAPLSKNEVLRHLLEGTAGSLAEGICDEEKDVQESNRGVSAGKGHKWIKIEEKKPLHSVLRQPDLVIPGIPVFYVVSRRTTFYRVFRAGNWTPP